jgi:hypothetical protein
MELGIGLRKRKEGSSSFLKKGTKKLSSFHSHAAKLNEQKFFGSFFKKELLPSSCVTFQPS